jgi:hypothetical protein
MEQQAPEQLESINLMSEPFKYGDDTINPSYALSLVNQTFYKYGSTRHTNFEGKWTESQALYDGVVAQRKWDNNQSNRSAIPNNIAFDHVEGAVAMTEAAIFDTGEDWMSVDAMDGADPRDAKKIRMVLQRDFDIPDPYYGFTTARSEIRLSWKSLYMKGEGVIFMEWDPIAKRPRLNYADILNLYVDDGCKTPNIDDARSIIIREEITVEDLQKFRGQPGMRVPSDAVMAFLMQTTPQANADNTAALWNNLQGVALTPPYTDLIPLPTGNRVELLRYYDKDRIIWILNRSVVMLIMRNPYRFYPVVAAPCRTMVNQFWGSSYPQAIQFQQRASEALLNGIVDEVSLIINPPQVIPQGAKPSQYTVYPGRTAENTGDAKQIVQQAPPGVTINLMPLIERLVGMADQRNGLNAATMGGNARPGNINRTRAGVNMQEQGVNTRLAHVIKNIEDYMLVPLFYKWHRMYQIHMAPDEVVMEPYPSQDPTFTGEPILAEVFHKPMRFSMQAASRLLTRNQVSQVLPFVMQTVTNGQLLSTMAAQNKTIDMAGVEEMINFATGAPKKFIFIRPMTEQEIQAKEQPPPQAMMEMQAKQADQQLRYQLAQENNQTKLQVAQIGKQPNPFDAQIKFQESQIKAQEAQQKIEAEREMMRMKLEAQAQEQQIKRAASEQEMALKQQQMLQKFRESQMGGQVKMQGHALEMQMMQERAQMERAMMAQRPQQQPKQGNER